MDKASLSISVSLSGIILAGGQSSRMGKDKALLEVNGVPLLRLVYNIAIALCDPVYVVTPWSERYQDLLPAHCQFIHEVPLPNHSPTPLPHGPLVGFAQGLAQIQTDWVLLLACDLPRLQVKVLQNWANELEHAGNAIALLSHHAKGWEPLCGFYHRSCLPALTEYIEQGGRSFQHWLAQHPIQLLPLTDAQMLFNCNTLADFAVVTSNKSAKS